MDNLYQMWRHCNVEKMAENQGLLSLCGFAAQAEF